MSYDRKDHFYKQAKSDGFRSRASFKLKEIQSKYTVLRSGQKVLDLGCWPGGWVQVAGAKVGPEGRVVGIDLKATDPFEFPNTLLIEGDVRDEAALKQATEFAGGLFDVVISDMSPKHSGIKQVDQAGTAHCVELAYWVSTQVLKNGGSFVAKAFPSGDIDRFVPELKKSFTRFNRAVLKSTRKTSKEFYLCASGFRRFELLAREEDDS